MFEYNSYDSEGAERKPLQPGLASFTIAEANELDQYGNRLVAKNGDEKIVLILKVKDSVGGSGKMFEHITANNGWKLAQICSAVGKGDLCSPGGGKIDPKFLIGLSGTCVLKMNNGYLNVGEYHKSAVSDAVADTVWQSNDEVPF